MSRHCPNDAYTFEHVLSASRINHNNVRTSIAGIHCNPMSPCQSPSTSQSAAELHIQYTGRITNHDVSRHARASRTPISMSGSLSSRPSTPRLSSELLPPPGGMRTSTATRTVSDSGIGVMGMLSGRQQGV